METLGTIDVNIIPDQEHPLCANGNSRPLVSHSLLRKSSLSNKEPEVLMGLGMISLCSCLTYGYEKQASSGLRGLRRCRPATPLYRKEPVKAA